MIRRSCFMILFVTSIASGLYPQAGDAGGTGLAFLKLGVGARAVALGEAYVAAANDATAIYWNPAGLTSLENAQLAFTHSEWLQDISNDFLALAFPLFGGTTGLSVQANQVDGIQRREIPSAEPLGEIDSHDLALSVSHARKLTTNLSAGISAKYLYQKIYVESASGYAVDFGVQFRPFTAPVTFGVAVQNLGSMNNLLDESVQLPTTLRAGVAYPVPVAAIDGSVLLAADVVQIRELGWRGHFGAEVKIKQHFALRAGYQAGVDERSFGGGFGIGFQKYHVDYGYTPFSSDLGNTHRFSVAIDL